MKTTIEISDQLLIDAKKKAAELRRPMRDIVEMALRRELERLAGHEVDSAEIEWVTVEGGLPPGVDIGSRESMSEWLAWENHCDRR